ncbi:hypothetical protein LWI28_028032 [Acer negundo]|uniref:TF-B3 domain-containing protein n=1 Tax=Acer negundo TaxID=4023 RepID=A0AAD5J308_ACENE|nr:hypothetical protein LWI28_028032 [Acer negundo]
MVKSSNKRFPDFFKVYLPARNSHRLHIPDAFVAHCGKLLPKKAVLSNHMGNFWHVDVVNTENGMHFLNGWHKFVQDNSLQYADFLVFKYNGDGGFFVKNLGQFEPENGDSSATGTSDVIQVNLEEREEEANEEDSNDHDSDDYDDSEDEDYNEDEDTTKEDDGDDDDDATIGKSRVQKRSGGTYDKHRKSEGSKKRVIVKEGSSKQNHNVVVAEAAAINKGKAFDVSNFVQPRNPHFIAKLRTKTKKNLLHVPSKVLERHNLDLPDLMIFQNEQGRHWPGQAFRWNDGRMWISGWKDFCKCNHVGVDDSCICEFLPGRDGKKGDIIQLQDNGHGGDTPRFFKVILASTLEENKLRIPGKFVRKFKDELSVFATITTPDSRIWQVGLLKDGGKIWFYHGLQDFIEYYSICVGYFLVFEYERRSKFHVIILDKSTFEISYPYNFEETKKEENLIHKKEYYRNQQGASNLDRSSNKCKMEEQVEVNTNTAHDGEDEHPTRIKDVRKLRALLEDKRIFLSIKYNFSSVKERKRVFNLARSLKPKNPSFMIMFRPSHLYSRVMYLPAKFVNKYLTLDIERIKLQASNGRKWPVQICWKRGGCITQEGWTEFLDGMKLKAGDICLFELIRMEDLLLEVSVFKSGKVGFSFRYGKTKLQKTRSQMRISKKFVRIFGNELSTVTLTVPNGQVWKVGLIRDGRTIWFRDGWHDFVQYNSISAGYFLVFKYGGNSNFNVLIFDLTACEIEYPYYGNELENDRHNLSRQDESENEDSIAIIGVTTPNTTFQSPKNKAFDKCQRSSSLMPSQLNRAKPSFVRALGVDKNQERGYESQNKRRKKEELVGSNQLNAVGSDINLKKTAYEVGTHSLDDAAKFDGVGLVHLLDNMGICVNMRFRNIGFEERERAIAAARLFKPKNPSFMVIWRSTENHRLYVPTKFARKYFSASTKSIKVLDSDGMKWSALLTSVPTCFMTKLGRFGKNLDGGDICVFELISQKILKVSVLKIRMWSRMEALNKLRMSRLKKQLQITERTKTRKRAVKTKEDLRKCLPLRLEVLNQLQSNQKELACQN